MPIESALAGIIAFIVLLKLPRRQSILLILLLVVLEGAIRKWVLPGASHFIYMLKDVVLLSVWVRALQQERQPSPLSVDEKMIKCIILFCSIIVVLQMFNPLIGSPVLGAFGARNYLLYIPLMFLVRDLFTSQDQLVKFFVWYFALAIPVCFLSLLQHFAPEDSILNVYARNESTERAMMGETVRVTGTFSYIAGYAAYLQTAAGLLIPLIVLELPFISKWLTRFSLLAIVIGMILTGSRGPILAFAIFMMLYFLLNDKFREHRLYKKFLTPVIFFCVVLSFWIGPALASFVQRIGDNADIAPRLMMIFIAPIQSLDEVGFLGWGAGAAYQARAVITNFFGLPPGEPLPAYMETEPQRVLFELGPVGFLLWYGLRVLLIVALWRTYKNLTIPLLKEFALAAFLVHVIALPGQVVFQITFLVYYWFLAGFVYLLPQIEAQELRRMSRRTGPSRPPQQPSSPPPPRSSEVFQFTPPPIAPSPR